MENCFKINNITLLSENIFNEAHDKVTTKFDQILLSQTHFSQGGFGKFFTKENQTYDSLFAGVNNRGIDDCFYGWSGAGGSIFIWSPNLNIGLSYTMTGMTNYRASHPRIMRIFNALFESISDIKKNKDK